MISSSSSIQACLVENEEEHEDEEEAIYVPLICTRVCSWRDFINKNRIH